MEMVDGSAVSSTVPFWVLCSALTLFLRFRFRFLRKKKNVGFNAGRRFGASATYFFVLSASTAAVCGCCSPAIFGVSSLMAAVASSVGVRDAFGRGLSGRLRRRRNRKTGVVAGKVGWPTVDGKRVVRRSDKNWKNGGPTGGKKRGKGNGRGGAGRGRDDGWRSSFYRRRGPFRTNWYCVKNYYFVTIVDRGSRGCITWLVRSAWW